jgi:DNA-binding MarR family transcriptional regulator
VPKTAKHPLAREYAEAAALREALRSFQRSSDEVTAAQGMTSRMYQLLLMIKTGQSGNERAGLTELEERLKLGKSTVTELVLRSEKRGLVRRELEPDSRGAIAVRLTPIGERRLAAALAGLGNERRRLLDTLSKLRAQ